MFMIMMPKNQYHDNIVNFYLNTFIFPNKEGKINALGSKTKYCFILHTMLSLLSSYIDDKSACK